MRRWYVLGMAAAVALQVAACAPPSPQEQAKEQVQESIDQAKESVGGTVEAKVEEVEATVETGMDAMSDATEGLADWGKAVATALGQLGVQASALKSDPTQMTNEDWTSHDQRHHRRDPDAGRGGYRGLGQALGRGEDAEPAGSPGLDGHGVGRTGYQDRRGGFGWGRDAFLAETEGLQKAMTPSARCNCS